VTGARWPESQEHILEAAVASLTEADIPPGEQDGWLDPDVDPPAELAALPDAELEELLAPDPPGPAPTAWPLSYRHPDGPGGAPWPAESAPRDSVDGSAGFGNSAGFASGDTGFASRGAGFASRDAGFASRGAGFASSGAGFATGPGVGFAEGGPLDVLAAGMALAGCADDAHARLAALTDDELIGVLRAWRRQACWAQARELAAVAELARRRPAEGTPPAATLGGFPAVISEFTADEVAMALTLTGRAAGVELDLALDLAARPATAAALETGQIDLPRAKILVSLLGPLAPAHADAVEAQILPRAGQMTTGQLRAALGRAVLAVDPDAARRRREDAEREARVEHWADPEGTASLAGRGLPPAAALTASSRLTEIAAAWKKYGAQGGMDLLRAHAYLALLNGQPVDTPPAGLLPPVLVPCHPGPVSGPVAGHGGRDGGPAPGPGGAPAPGGLGGPGRGLAADGPPPLPARLGGPGHGGPPPIAGLINLTVPLTTLLGLAHGPGDAGGHGPLDAAATRQLARTLAGHPATRWQIIITTPDGHALAHGAASGPARAKAGTGESDRGWAITVTAEPITTGPCDHRTAEPGYRPSPALQRLIRARTVTCSGPGCRRPAARCDLDHTVPHDSDGLTCECNLGPACRHCHRRKQTPGWELTQPTPGTMTWTTPAGRRYTTLPSKHPT
jgi:Domain of unknown function (DUF222)